MPLLIKQGTGRLLGLMLLIVVAGLLIARSYYGKKNRAVDPRITEARERYKNYNTYARTGDYYRVFSLLDRIEAIYMKVPHYRQSFELGVLDNNRAAALLTLALYRDSIPPAANPFYELTADTLVLMAESHIRHALNIYQNWDRQYGSLNEEELSDQVALDFFTGLEIPADARKEDLLKARVLEIQNSLKENPRRMSVCYSNLGLTYRYQKQYEEAAGAYEKALQLWDRNLEAENNLNRLLGRPLKKRNFIQRLFPPDRESD